jgi:hypothetical protein
MLVTFYNERGRQIALNPSFIVRADTHLAEVGGKWQEDPEKTRLVYFSGIKQEVVVLHDFEDVLAIVNNGVVDLHPDVPEDEDGES